jgi:Family of unknown function (DUF5681)
MKKSDLPPDHETSKVGYCSPPKAHQFRKGRSGNPRGRKTGEENMIAIFKRLATRRVKVNDNGRFRMLPLAEAIILQNIKAALQRNSNAVANMFRLAEEADEFKDWSDPKVAGGLIFMPGKLSEEEFMVEYDSGVINMPSRTSGSQED